MKKEQSEEQELLRIARSAIEAGLNGREYQPPHLPPPWDRPQGVFVTLHGPNKDLRGCIGHITGVCNTLSEEVAQCAAAAAFEDPRFRPVTQHELPTLALEISLLGPLEEVHSPSELDPHHWGVVVSHGHRRGLLLPALEGVDTVGMQLDIARRKAGISPSESVMLQKFKVRKIQESH